MAEELTYDEEVAAHAIPVWAVFRVAPGAEARAVSFHLTRGSALEDQERRGGPPGDETEGFEVRGETLLSAFKFGTFSVEEARREIARETARLEEVMFERVRAFVVAETGIAKAAIERGSLVVDDLGIRGREGARLVARFFQAFGVDPMGFEVTRYFAPETMGLLGSISTLMAGGPPRLPLAIDDLVDAAMAGRWLQ